MGYYIDLGNLTIEDCQNKLESAYNDPVADNAGGLRKLAFTKPANDKGKANIKQVNPAMRLPAERCA